MTQKRTTTVTVYALCDSIERLQRRLQAELLQVRDREKVLQGSQAALEYQLKQLQTELSESRHDLEAGRLELSKTVALNNTFQRKHKVST